MKEIANELIAKGYTFSIKLIYDDDREEFKVYGLVTGGLNTKRTSPVICTLDNYEALAADCLIQCLGALENPTPPCINDVI